MDSAILGALIGIGVMGCLALTTVFYEKGAEWKERLLRKWRERRHLHAPLLPVVKENPVLIRSTSKQFQLRELLPLK